MCLKFLTNTYTGCVNKNNPLGKVNVSVIITDFVTEFAAFTEENSGHIFGKFSYNNSFYLKVTSI